MHRMGKSTVFVFQLAAVLLCLTLLTTCAMGRMYARYYTGTEFGDGARVAKFTFNSTDTLTDTKTYAVVLDPQKPQTLAVTLKNDSETALRCTVRFAVEGNAPLAIAAPTGMTAEDGSETAWYMDLPAGDAGDHKLDFTVELQDANYTSAGSVARITLSVRAEQLD